MGHRVHAMLHNWDNDSIRFGLCEHICHRGKQGFYSPRMAKLTVHRSQDIWLQALYSQRLPSIRWCTALTVPRRLQLQASSCCLWYRYGTSRFTIEVPKINDPTDHLDVLLRLRPTSHASHSDRLLRLAQRYPTIVVPQRCTADIEYWLQQ